MLNKIWIDAPQPNGCISISIKEHNHCMYNNNNNKNDNNNDNVNKNSETRVKGDVLTFAAGSSLYNNKTVLHVSILMYMMRQ